MRTISKLMKAVLNQLWIIFLHW